jgi:hypothetical protein
MVTSTDLARQKAVELLQSNPQGLHYIELHGLIAQALPNIPPNTIHGALWTLTTNPPKGVFKPTRGLYKYRPDDSVPDTGEPSPAPSPSLREEDFYEPFAIWLKTELDECTEAVALGGAAMGKKWGTPDVVGIYKPSARDIIKFNSEITSAEIKINSSDPITAFGQAIAYRLFSTQTYLVEPDTMGDEDKARIESLCILFGVGFVLFKPNPKNPQFSIRVRAQRFNPDMFFVNQFAEQLFKVRGDLFAKLFS